MKKIFLTSVVIFFASCSMDSELRVANNSSENKEVIDYELINQLTESLTSNIQNNVDHEEEILLFIDHNILKGCFDRLVRLIQDINLNHQNVYIKTEIDFSFEEVRETIQQHYIDDQIDGSIFIGDIPIPKAKYTTHFGTTYTGLSTQFYMDIDGTFEFDTNNIIVDHGGEYTIDIWNSVIPAYGQDPIQNINDYLDKNHIYRNSSTSVERGFCYSLIGNDIDDVATYFLQYDHIIHNVFNALHQRGNSFIGFDNTLENSNLYPTARDFYQQALVSDKYDIAKIGAHGNSISFGSYDEYGSIIVDVEYAQTTQVKPMVLLDPSCNTAAINKSKNLACEFLYNKDNNVLVYCGATAPQGGQGKTQFGIASNYKSEKMISGNLLGEALLAPMYHEYIEEFQKEFREYFSAQQIVLGDGSLKLQEFMD